MKPIFRKIDTCYNNYSFSVREDIFPYLYNHWRYHPEVELTLIRKGRGMRLVGDSIEQFNSGDLVLLGSHLPHLWGSDAIYFEHVPGLTVEAVAIHFKDDFWGRDFIALMPEHHLKRIALSALLFPFLFSCHHANTLFKVRSASSTGITFNNNVIENDSINSIDLEFKGDFTFEDITGEAKEE